MYAENAEAGGLLYELANQYGPAVITAVPLLFLAGYGGIPGATSAGMEAYAYLQQTNPSVISQARIFLDGIVKTPKFWYVVASKFGPYYDSAVENGASKIEAAAYATSSSFFDAVIETDDRGSNNRSSIENVRNAGYTNIMMGLYTRVSEYQFYRKDMKIFDIFDMSMIWGDFVEGVVSEGLTETIQGIGSAVWKAVDATSMYDLTPNGFPLDTWDEFKQKYASSLSKFDDTRQREAYRYYLTDMTTIKYNGERMNFMRFLSEKLMETSGNIDLYAVENAFKNLFDAQFQRSISGR